MNLHEAWHRNMDASQGEAGDPVSLSICHSAIGIPINFQEESGIVTFGSIDLGKALDVSRDLRPCVLMRPGPRDFSRDCTEHSDIPLSCEMKDEPAFKPLQGYPAFFRVMASRYHST